MLSHVGVTKTVDEADIEGGYDAIKQSIRDMAKKEPLPRMRKYQGLSKLLTVRNTGGSIMEFSKVMIDLGKQLISQAVVLGGCSVKVRHNITECHRDDF